MSEFTDLYRARQDLRWRLWKAKKDTSPDSKYWKIKDEEQKLGLKLDEIIKREKVKIKDSPDVVCRKLTRWLTARFSDPHIKCSPELFNLLSSYSGDKIVFVLDSSLTDYQFSYTGVRDAYEYKPNNSTDVRDEKIDRGPFVKSILDIL